MPPGTIGNILDSINRLDVRQQRAIAYSPTPWVRRNKPKPDLRLLRNK
jgi:hypothetical protein